MFTSILFIKSTVLAQSFLKLSPRELVLWRLRWRQTQQFGVTNHNQYSIYFARWGRAKSKSLAPAFKSKKPELFAKGFDGKFHATDAVLRKNYPQDVNLPP